MNKIKGYKAFNPDWTSYLGWESQQYKCPGKFEEDAMPRLYTSGIHFNITVVECVDSHLFLTTHGKNEYKVAEVIAYGDIDKDIIEGTYEYCTNKLEIVRELSKQEVLDLINTGKNCIGIGNTRNYNNGDFNSGSHNFYSFNSGNKNTGYKNTGDRNVGSCNCGNTNKGSFNSGSYNNGNDNTGSNNVGDKNSGSCNHGCNNTGNFNQGNYNVGSWNKTSFATGCFNTERTKLKFFDQETDMTIEQWQNSYACCLLEELDTRPVIWLRAMGASAAQIADNPNIEVTCGYIEDAENDLNYNQRYWNNLSKEDQECIKNIPNFNAEKFFEITKIRVEDKGGEI